MLVCKFQSGRLLRSLNSENYLIKLELRVK